jgi:uncharacterized protein
MDVGVTGSSGLIGTALVARLHERGHRPVPIVRRAPVDGEIGWDPEQGRLDPADLAPLDAVVHLAGPSIGGHRWTAAYKRELRAARVGGTSLVARTLATMEPGPEVLVSASAIGYYGTSADATFDESSPAGDDFLAGLCRDWEAAAQPAVDAGVRVATIRSGVVLSPGGGALARLLPLFRLGLGGRFGSGRQWQSWISIDDHVDAVVHILEGALRGPVNLTAPTPVRNAEFTSTLAAVLHRPAVLPIPHFGPSLVVGRELTDTLLYQGQRVLPRALEADGFRFGHGELEAALRAILRR